MSKDKCFVMHKKDLIERLSKGIPDDAFIILPAWGMNGKISIGKKRDGEYHPYMDMRLLFASDIFSRSDSIGGMYNLMVIPVTFLMAEDAQKLINQHGFDLVAKDKAMVEGYKETAKDNLDFAHMVEPIAKFCDNVHMSAESQSSLERDNEYEEDEL
jgi:hypothetical protein